MANGTYLVLRRGKRLINPGPGMARVLPLVWTAREVRRLKRQKVCYDVVNLKTQRKSKVGGACPRKK